MPRGQDLGLSGFRGPTLLVQLINHQPKNVDATASRLIWGNKPLLRLGNLGIKTSAVEIEGPEGIIPGEGQ